MLELKNITKTYITDSFKQTALDNVSINFRKNEFASILGPSGSGKTSFLNIIGGLDHYDTGNLIINETSTKKYTDRDWDTFRNHRIGFVFQNYNLINHQTVLSNVELALTLSGVSKKLRRGKAKKALKQVDLEKHINKKPSQLSGGQMQRVAIARALVNDPDILLADEPTGALDSETSIQIMNILKDIAKNKLVIMVTHNAELANSYSTRIIKLKDGKIIADTNPFDGKVNTKLDLEKEKKNTKKTSMNIRTALSLSNGIQNYIDKVQKETLASYPITIDESTVDFTSIINNTKDQKEVKCKNNKICTKDDISNNPYLTIKSSIIKNNLSKFKIYLDKNGGNINFYVTDIQYKYNLDLQIYSKNSSDKLIKVTSNNRNNSFMTKNYNETSNSISTDSLLTNPFTELIDNKDLLNSQYKLLTGKMPSNYNEMLLIVDENNNIPLSVIYSLDIETRDKLTDIIKKASNNKKINLDSISYNYNDLLNRTYKLILNTDFYEKEGNIWVNKKDNSSYLENLYNNGVELKIVGIAKAKEDTTNANSDFVGYTHDLVKYVINEINNREITKVQLENKDINIFTGTKFDEITSTYDNNLELLGINKLESPTSINIYPKDFTSKEKIEEIIKDYNKTQKKGNQINYTDMVGTLLSGITTIVNVISIILIVFVAISLIVSSIMIAIITYISVLERTKEIGILRSIGASKRNISEVFNAETFIIGLFAGLFGVIISWLLLIPINHIIHKVTDIYTINAYLPINSALILVALSVILTLIGGIIPSRKAAKVDPVQALRSE